eukprot:9055372-Pyramimonas_sp.AAC.1
MNQNENDKQFVAITTANGVQVFELIDCELKCEAAVKKCVVAATSDSLWTIIALPRASTCTPVHALERA